MEEPRVMGRQSWQLQKHQKKTRNEPDHTLAQTHCTSCVLALAVEKLINKTTLMYFSSTIVSAELQPEELFQEVRDLFPLGPKGVRGEFSEAHHEIYSRMFANNTVTLLLTDSGTQHRIGMCRVIQLVLFHGMLFRQHSPRVCWGFVAYLMLTWPSPFLADEGNPKRSARLHCEWLSLSTRGDPKEAVVKPLLKVGFTPKIIMP